MIEENSRFRNERLSPTQDLMIDLRTGIEYLVIYPNENRNVSESLTVQVILDRDGFPNINEEWKKENDK